VNNELKELKAMYRKVVEAHRVLRADFRTSEEKRYSAEQRAEAAEREVVVRSEAAPSAAPDVVEPVEKSAELTRLHEEAKHARRETDALWKAIASAVDASVFLALRRSDTETRAYCEVEVERQRRAALWEALRESVDAEAFAAVARSINGGTGVQPALPVSVARRLFEAADGAKTGEGTPRQCATARPPPALPSASQKRHSFSWSSSRAQLFPQLFHHPPSRVAACATPGRARRDSGDSASSSLVQLLRSCREGDP